MGIKTTSENEESVAQQRMERARPSTSLLAREEMEGAVMGLAKVG
jgi:hypothetical protein